MRDGPILVAVDDQPQTPAAVRFAERIACSLGRPLILVTVYEAQRWQVLVGTSSTVERRRARAETALDAAARVLVEPDACDTLATASSSAARGLHELADEQAGALLVLGRSHHSGVARRLGGTAEALLHGAPCPLAVVPDTPTIPTGPVLVGYDDTPESDAAASLAAELAESLGAQLELCHVSAPTASPEHRDRDRAFTENMHRIAQRMLDDGVSRIPTAFAPTTTILEGSPGCELARRAVARAATCVVMGSRGYGPVRAVLLGSVTRELLDRASTPVVVAPRPESAHASMVTATGRNARIVHAD